MKRLILPTALAVALSGSLAFAQQAPAPIERPGASQQSAPDAQQPAEPMHHHHKPNPSREAARVSRELNLTPDQTAKLEPIFADRDQKIAALMANDQLAPSDRHHQMHAIQKSTDEQLAGFLTPDQVQQIRQMKKRHGRHGEAPEGAPDQAPPAPPSTT